MDEMKISFKKTLSNSFWPIAQNIINLSVSVFITAIVARYLGPEKYGIMSYILSVIMLFTAFATLGTETVVIKEIVDNSKQKSTIIGTSFLIRLIGGFILVILSQLTLFILTGGEDRIQIMGLILGLGMIFKSFEVIEYYLQATMKLKIIFIIKVLTMILISVCRILVVIFDLGIVALILTYLIDAIIVGIILYIYYKFKIKEKWKFDFNCAMGILSKCWFIALSGLMITIYMRIDQVMLGSMLQDKSQNGIYSAAVKIAEMWYFIPLAVVSAFQPVIMSMKKDNNGDYINIMQKLYDLIAIIGIVCGIGITIFAAVIINIVYGSQYAGAGIILSISVWGGLFATLGCARQIWLVTEGFQKYTVAYSMVGCLINIGINYILIPIYGALGAAIATLLSQIVSNIFVLLLFNDTRISSKMIIKSIFKNKLIKDTFLKFREKFNKI